MQHDETTNEELTVIVSGAGLLPALDISNKNRYIYTIKSNKGLLFSRKKTKEHGLKIFCLKGSSLFDMPGC